MKENNAAFSGAAPGSAEERRRARTRKRRLMLCVGCAVLVVLTGAILLLNAAAERRAAEEEAAASAGPAIAVAVLPESGAADSLRFTTSDGGQAAFVLDPQGLWTLEGDPTCPVDSAAVQTRYNKLLDLKAYESFTAAEELSEYGLEQPVLTITLADSAAGASRTLKLGAQNGASSRYYLSIGEGDTLYTVSDELYTAFYIRLTDLLRKEELPVFSSNDITAVTVAAPGAEPLYLTPTEEQQDGVTLWQAVQGEETLQVDAATGVTILDRLASISYNSMAAWRPDAAALAGLAMDEAQRTAITVEYTVTDEKGISVSDSLTLYVGGTDAGTGGLYAFAQGHNAVYTITAAKVEGLLRATPADLAAIGG